MNSRVILFDADGMTLIPKRFSDQISADYGITWEIMKPFFSGPFQACKLGRADLKEELAKVIPQWGWKGSVDELMIYWFSIGSTVQPEIPTAIESLHKQGALCYLATNQEKYRLDYLKQMVGINQLFDGFFASAELGHLKNERGFFEKSNEILRAKMPDLEKEDVLFIDHEEENIETARSFGYTTYHYSTMERFYQEIVNRIDHH